MAAMSDLGMRLFQSLGDGAFHSGETLAAGLGVTRSAVWKSIRQLRTLGAEIHSVPHRGYRLRTGGALDGPQILRALPRAVRARIVTLQVAWSIGSTNAALLERPAPAPGAAVVQLAEFQTAGRGRRGRAWVAPLGGALCLSIGWTFPQLPRDIAALSLAVGVCVRRALAERNVAGIELKWPNDLLARGRKLGGILIELRAESGGPGYVVVGLGLNLALSPQARKAVAATGAQAIDLAALAPGAIDRNELAAELIARISSGLADFAERGFAAFAKDWAAADALVGRRVLVQGSQHSARGTARGIDASGALLVQTAAGLERHISGEVTVRAET
jgi:BirA family biotin operon repressor/biotin-[acetyl-CoA-carboxylase] ligase